MRLTTQIDQRELDRVIESEWAYLLSEADQWSLLRGEQDMEILEHVLRCILHVGNTFEYMLKTLPSAQMYKILMVDGLRCHIQTKPPYG